MSEEFASISSARNAGKFFGYIVAYKSTLSYFNENAWVSPDDPETHFGYVGALRLGNFMEGLTSSPNEQPPLQLAALTTPDTGKSIRFISVDTIGDSPLALQFRKATTSEIEFIKSALVAGEFSIEDEDAAADFERNLKLSPL